LFLVGVALVVVFTLLNWQANHTKPQNLFSEWIEPFTAKPVAEASPAQEEPAPHPPTESKPLEAASTVTEHISPVLAPPIAVAAVTAPTATAPAVKASAVTEAVVDCKLLTTEPTPASPVSVNKPGSYVYLLPTKDVQVCVDDGKRVQTVVNLKAGQGRSIHGSAPWVIGSNQISAVQVYFQGAKVMIPKDAGQRIVLKEQALQN
jgi:hypothetical protein